MCAWFLFCFVCFPSDRMNDFVLLSGGWREGEGPRLTLPHWQGLSNKFVCSVLSQRTEPLNEKRDLLASVGISVMCGAVVPKSAQNPEVNFVSGPSINLFCTQTSFECLLRVYMWLLPPDHTLDMMLLTYPFDTSGFVYSPSSCHILQTAPGKWWSLLPHASLHCPSLNHPTQMSNDALCYSLDNGWGNWGSGSL